MRAQFSKENLERQLYQLRSDEPGEFNTALEFLRTHCVVARRRIYRAAVREKNPKVKGALIELLGTTRDREFVPYLESELKSQSMEVRFWAFVALQQIESQAERLTLRRRNLRSLMDGESDD